MRSMPPPQLNSSALLFELPEGCGILNLSGEVLRHFDAHKQRNMFACESGGQLFATFEETAGMQIKCATGPRPTDKRWIYGYHPDRKAEKAEIHENFARGLHFVGDWHTHRQRIPEPSSTDTHNIRELVRLSSHDLAGFVLIVVGYADFPAGLHVSFHSRSISTTLAPIFAGHK